MKSTAQKISRLRREQGVAGLVSRAIFSLYRSTLRRLLPDRGYVLYGGLPVGRARKAGDAALLRRFLPPDLCDNPIYEQALMEGLRVSVRPGDRVAVIGGGEGITAAHAALLAGGTGTVTCYEGDGAGIRAVLRTARANGVADRFRCVHAVVGDNLGVFGTDIASTVIHPDRLAECDVLEMDCEGSEVRILREMTIRPRAIVVETHGFAGAPTTDTMAILRERGYLVEDLGLAEPKEACIGRDEHVVLARLPEH